MSEIDRFRPDDRRGVETLYRRTHGPDAAEAHRLRWEWQHRRNPNNPTGQPGIWVAREGPTVVGVSSLLILIFLVISVLVDLLHVALDPRLRRG